MITIRSELLGFSSQALFAVMPYLVICLGALLTLFFGVSGWFRSKWFVFVGTLAVCLVGIVFSVSSQGVLPITIFNHMISVDAYSFYFNFLFLSCVICIACISVDYLERQKLYYPEYYFLLLMSALGMMLMTSVLDLVVLFIALELMSLSIYLLVGWRRSDRRSNEAAMKYFILGALGSSLFLYGVALLYGATGSTHLGKISTWISQSVNAPSLLWILGFVLVLIGLFFKAAIVPCHMWVPDVYEGAIVPVTGFMATGLKIAVFGAMIRVLMQLLFSVQQKFSPEWIDAFYQWLKVAAVATMLVGNCIALMQNHLKRLMGYSSIAHSGYLLVGLIVAGQSNLGIGPVLFYLGAYLIVNLGFFVVLSILAGQNDSDLTVQNLSGLSKRHPVLAFSLAIFLFSMAGIPPTAGFVGKYLIFSSGIQAGQMGLILVSVFCSAISVYYYLRIVGMMYMRDALVTEKLKVPFWSGLCLGVLVLLTLQLGIAPNSWTSSWVYAAMRAMR